MKIKYYWKEYWYEHYSKNKFSTHNFFTPLIIADLALGLDSISSPVGVYFFLGRNINSCSVLQLQIGALGSQIQEVVNSCIKDLTILSSSEW